MFYKRYPICAISSESTSTIPLEEKNESLAEFSIEKAFTTYSYVVHKSSDSKDVETKIEVSSNPKIEEKFPTLCLESNIANLLALRKACTNLVTTHNRTWA